MSNVIKFNGLTKLDIPALDVLNAATEHGLDSVVLCGYDKDGKLYLASSLGDTAETVLLLERFKKFLLDYVEASETEAG